MKSEKFLFMALVLLVSLLCVSAVSAADDAAVSDIVADTNDATVLEESINGDVLDSQSDENVLKEDPVQSKNFTELKNLIDNGEDEIELESDYIYDGQDKLVDGIEIDHNLTINGNGHKLDANEQARIFHVTSNVVVTFKDISFVKGKTFGSFGYGAAIWADNGCAVKAINCNFTGNFAYYGAVAQVNAENCIFTDNIGGDGGALFEGNATNCIFKNNEAYYEGGAIFARENMYIAVNCTFINNTAGNYGGAIYNASAKNCTFTDNVVTRYDGGAIFEGSATDCIFTGNSAGGNGGALAYSNAVNCTFTQNTAGTDGGAIYAGDSATGCIFTKNSASGEGGAIKNIHANGCTFTDNAAGTNGGAMFTGDATNCTFIGNSANKTGGAMVLGIATGCTFIGNSANETGGALVGSATNCTFNNNSAYRGGAMVNGTATGCDFTGNEAGFNGGAMVNGTAVDSTFTGNIADFGGALYYCNATNCTFTGNAAGSYGGAMNNGNATDCTFTKNNANETGGATIYVDATNCIFTVNSASENGGAMHLGKAKNCTFQLNTVADEYVSYENCLFIIPSFSASDLNTCYGYGDKFNFTIAGTQFFNGVNATVSIYKDGVFVANYSALSGEGWTVDLPVGIYTAVLSVPGSDMAPLNRTITVAKNPTSITASAVTATYNVNKYLVITLTDGKGNKLSGVNVTVTLGSAKVYTTDKNGQIKINVAKLVPKTYTAKISFAGNDSYAAVSKSVKVVVKKATPKLTAKAKSFKVKVKTKKYTVTLKNNKGAVLKKVKLTLRINKKTFKATTNSKGVATFKITNLKKKGKFSATVKFAGSKYYNKLSKKVKITIKR